jgi:hypothetical protein
MACGLEQRMSSDGATSEPPPIFTHDDTCIFHAFMIFHHIHEWCRSLGCFAYSHYCTYMAGMRIDPWILFCVADTFASGQV